MRARTRSAITWASAAIAAVLAWLLLAPPALGGSTTIVVVAGPSMEPTYHSGDLVIARGQRDYAAGDVVVFRTDHGNVVHRITGGSSESGYTTQGDNNSSPDSWLSTGYDVLGRAVLHVPEAGRYLLIARTVLITPPFPYLLAGFAFLAIVLSDRRPEPEASAEVDVRAASAAQEPQ